MLKQLNKHKLSDLSFREETADPVNSIANLFDVAMVFAVAFMVALVSFLKIPGMLQNQDYTVIVNPGQPNMEMIVKEGEVINHYEATDAAGSGQGELLGKAYRLRG